MRAKSPAFRAVLLGAAFLSTVGCGGGEKPSADSSGSSGAKITALGPAAVDGCSFGLAFDIQAPAAIGLVGIAPQGGIVGTPSLSLYAVDSFGQEQLVAQQATSVTANVATLLSQAFASASLVAGDNLTALSSSGQNASVLANDANRNGTSYTVSESGSYARDTYGDTALLADSLAGAGYSGLGGESVAQTWAPLVASSLDGSQITTSLDRGATNSAFGDASQGSYGGTALGAFDNAARDSNLWANRAVETGIGSAHVREAWGKNDVLASQNGADATSAFGNNASATQGSSNASYLAQQAIQNAVAFSALDSLSSRHFVLRIQAQALGGAAGVQVFQGTESQIYATEGATVALPACGN